MQVQIVYGVQKYNLEIPCTTAEESSTEETSNSEIWTLGKLKEEIEKLIQVPVANQRLIRKGTTLFGNDVLLSTLNLKEGDKIMVIGQKREPVEDPILKSLGTIEHTVLQGIENRLKEVDEQLQGIDKGFLNKELVASALNGLDKQLKHLGEDCMRTLELMDSMKLSDDQNDKPRTIRKSLVKRVQALLQRHDELVEKVKIVSVEMNRTGDISTIN